MTRFWSHAVPARKCPNCGAPVEEAEDCFIDWKEDKKQFTVRLTLRCTRCGHRFEGDLVKRLPLTILETSTCSCGSQLSLADYSIKRVGDDVEFKGVYRCSKCNTTKRTLVRDVKKSISNTWRSIKKLDIGPKGLSIEKT